MLPHPAAPYAPPIAPMLALLAKAIPADGSWLYEPKWDGFRCLVFYDGSAIYLQSRDRKPLARYFPELTAGLPPALTGPMVLDGEIVIMGERGLDFDALLQRIHPAGSRISRLAAETPASFVAFDILAADGDDLMARPFSERRQLLRTLLPRSQPPLFLTPATEDAALAAEWFDRFEGAGLDGIVAKRLDQPYQPGVRAMVKVKHLRTVDCVVGGLRWDKGKAGQSVASLLLGLYDEAGILHYVGHTSSFTAAEKRALVDIVAPHVTDDATVGFGRGRTPGGPSRWRQDGGAPWTRLRPDLVCEVVFDYLQGNRFRHGSTFHRWRPDKPPRECRWDQLIATVPYELREVFGSTTTSLDSQRLHD